MGVNVFDRTEKGLMARENAFELLPALFEVCRRKVDVPAANGVPLMTPEKLFSERPAGSVPPVTDQMMGVPPEAVSVPEYPVPTVPEGSEVDVITGGRSDSATLMETALKLL